MREVSLNISRLSVAKKLVKLELMRNGIKISTVKQDDITTFAKRLIAEEPEYVEYAFRLMLP